MDVRWPIIVAKQGPKICLMVAPTPLSLQGSHAAIGRQTYFWTFFGHLNRITNIHTTINIPLQYITNGS